MSGWPPGSRCTFGVALADHTRFPDPKLEILMIPSCPRRTPKWKILFRLCIIPFLVVCFWTFFFSLVGLGTTIFLAGVGTIAAIILFLWGFTNLMTLITMPRVWWLLKRGGGDPWFESLPEPFNTDDLSTRFQELYREKTRQEWEQAFGPLPQVPPQSPDFTRGIDDPHII